MFLSSVVYFLITYWYKFCIKNVTTIGSTQLVRILSLILDITFVIIFNAHNVYTSQKL